MNRQDNIFTTFTDALISLGAYQAAIIEASEIETDLRFRAMCESNACGMYGKCYMCPPDVGEIESLMAEIGEYDYALVYQTVT